MLCVLLHLRRKASKYGRALPSAAAESRERGPKRAHVTEHAAVQVQYLPEDESIFKLYFSCSTLRKSTERPLGVAKDTSSIPK